MKKPPKVSAKERIQTIWMLLRWNWKASSVLLSIIFGISIIIGSMAIVEPYVFKTLLDKITGISTAKAIGLSIASIMIIYCIIKIIENFMWDLQNSIRSAHAKRLDHYVNKMMMLKVSSLDAEYFENSKYYTTLTKANDGMWRVNECFWRFSHLTSQIVGLAMIIGGLFLFNWRVVALVVAAAIPSIYFALKKTDISWGVFDAYSPIAKQANYYEGLLVRKHDAVKEIRLFNLQPTFIRKFDILVREFIKQQDKATKKHIGINLLVAIIEASVTVYAAWLVIQAFLAGTITIGELTFFWALLFQFADRMKWTVREISEINEDAIFLSPVRELLAFEKKIKNVDNPVPFPDRITRGIEFKNVSFTYPGASKPTLKNINLKISAGDSLALVGENGSGKTTLIKLLCRLYDATSGEILIDGINIKSFRQEDLQKNIGVIFQDFVKYEASAGENISFGNIFRKNDKKGIHDSSRKAEAWEFIKDLKKRYQAHLGKTLKDKGTELSGGQWQKIALSRAFFKDAPMLVLDEPTSAVDAKAEYEIFKKFEQLTKDKTTILISHRFSTVRTANMIAVIENGKIVEHGNHSQLMKKKGRYAKLFEMQAKNYRD